jgi:hypothetical protein
MNEGTQTHGDLDDRLRRLCSRLDAGPGFTARVLAQALRTGAADQSRRALRARSAAEHARTMARLRARLWRMLGLTATAGLAAAAVAWMLGSALAGALTALARGSDWTAIGIGSAALLCSWLWIAVREATRGRASPLAPG